MWCLQSSFLLGLQEKWILPPGEVICVHTSSDHSGGCDGALPAEGHKSDLGENSSGPGELLTEEERVDCGGPSFPSYLNCPDK